MFDLAIELSGACAILLNAGDGHQAPKEICRQMQGPAT